MNHARLILPLFGLLLLCSCATDRPAHADLPADLKINMDAGRGGELIVAVRLEGGEELPLVVDTGSPVTFFDKSFEPKLGKRLDTRTTSFFDSEQDSGVYAAPKLYLGTALLQDSQEVVGTCDFSDISRVSERRIMGLLGMDYLAQYCVQLDFRAGKMCFLSPGEVKPERLGKAYPLIFSSEGQGTNQCFRPFINCGSLMVNGENHLIVDTGCNIDGGLGPALFQREVERLKLIVTNKVNARFPGCSWEGGDYTNLFIRTWSTNHELADMIGLRFLARHLVTLDFPNRMMYLKQTSVGPLPWEDVEKELQRELLPVGKTTQKLLSKLKKAGQLPGWSRKDDVATSKVIFHYHYPDSVTFDVRKKGSSSLYHFQVTRASEDDHWKLTRAWRADAKDRTVEEFPIH